METTALAEIGQAFLDRVHRMVWCNVATVDGQGRPRSRILHPIWEVDAASATGWLFTRRETPKARHLAGNPYVSLAYVAEIATPVYVDCLAAWEDDPAQKRRIWEMLRVAPAPLGYDPATIFGAPDDPGLGLLRLAPWRIELDDVSVIPAIRQVWRQ